MKWTFFTFTFLADPRDFYGWFGIPLYGLKLGLGTRDIVSVALPLYADYCYDALEALVPLMGVIAFAIAIRSLCIAWSFRRRGNPVRPAA